MRREKLRAGAGATALAAVGLCALVVAVPSRAGEPVPQAWAGTTFADPQALAAWLRGRGGDYRDWAIRHPAAAAALEGRVVESSAPAWTDARYRSTLAPVAAQQSRRGRGPVLPLLAGVAAVLLALAAVPLRTAAPFDARPGPLGRRRLELAAAGGAMLVGIAIAYAIG